MITIPRIVVAGTSGGSGKTLLSLGLIRAFARRGLRVAAFKKGPDYIDAAWLTLAAGHPCRNLDPYFCTDSLLKSLFSDACAHADIAVIEGNRGLYDGRDADGTCSTAALSRLFAAPVVLSLNCTKMTRTAAAVVAGMAHFEPIVLAGVVLSQIGAERHAAVACESIEKYTDIPVLGILPRMRPNPIPERHMGLIGADGNAVSVLDRIADLVEKYVDIKSILTAASNAPTLPDTAPLWTPPTHPSLPKPVIGYVFDEALWFYYPENLEALRRASAELIPLSILDNTPWPRLDGLYLGGGFPETYADRLSSSSKVAALKTLSQSGLPIYAECGGFMTLCNAVIIDGKRFPMAGVFASEAEFTPVPQGLGYIEAAVSRPNPYHPDGVTIRGHEFHYSRCKTIGELQACLTLKTGVGMGPNRKNTSESIDGFIVRNTFASYTHLFAPAVPHWANRFVALCRAHRNDTASVSQK